jgi:hypothetical protein
MAMHKDVRGRMRCDATTCCYIHSIACTCTYALTIERLETTYLSHVLRCLQIECDVICIKLRHVKHSDPLSPITKPTKI